MNRRSRTALPLLALCLSLTASVHGKVTIKWLQGNVQASYVKAAVAAFEKEYPNIKVEPIIVAWDQVDDKFLTMTVGGTAIDVISNASAYGWARYRDKGLFTPLDAYLNRDKAEVNPSDFPQKIFNAYKYKGKLISLPVSNYLACSVKYNANLLAEAGLSVPTYDWDSPNWRWDDLVMYAKKLTKAGANGKISQYGLDFWNADNLVTFSWANGGDYFDDESYKSGKVNRILINSPENVQAFSKVAELNTVYKARGLALDGFRSGKLAMWMDATTIEDHSNKKVYKNEFKWGVAPFPMMKAGVREAFAWNEVLAIPASSKHREEAWTFLKWFSKTAGTKGTEWPDISARKSVWSKVLDWKNTDLCVLEKPQLKKYIEGAVENSRQIPRDVVFGSQEVYTAANKFLTMGLDGKMAIPAALARAQAEGEVAKKKVIRK